MIRDEESLGLQQPSRSFFEMKRTRYPLTPEGIGEFFRDSSAVLIRRFIMKGQDPDLVMDTAQEIYASLFRKAAGLGREYADAAYGAPLFGWVSQAFNWKMQNSGRSKIGNNTVVSSGIVEASADPHRFEDGVANSLIVREVLEGLPKNERVFIEGRYFDNLSFEEIASMYDVPQKSVERLTYQGLQHARDIITMGFIRRPGRPRKSPQNPE